MIKPRKRFLTVILVMAVIFFWIHSYINSPAFEAFIVKSVEESLSDSFEGEINVDKISLGFFSVKISGANISVPLNSVSLKIDDITVGFSLRALLRKRWTPDELIDKIILINPEIYYEPLFDQNETEQGVLPSEIAEQVLKNVKVRELLIRNCKVTVVAQKGTELITITDLDGRALKEDDSFSLSLKKKKRLGRSQFSVELFLTSDVAKQRLSVQSNNYAITTVLPKDNSIFRAKIDGSLEFSFLNKPYPTCLSPDGTFDIYDIALEKGKKRLWNSKKISFVARKGVLSSDNVRVDIGQGTLSGTISTSFGDQFLLLGLHYTDSLEGISAHAVIEHDSTLEAHQYKHSFSALKDSMVLSGSGFVSNGIISIAEGNFSLPGVAGVLSGTVSTENNRYELLYEGGFFRALDSVSKVQGDFSFNLLGGFTTFPQVSGIVRSDVIYDSIKQTLPPLQIALDPLGNLELSGANSDLSLSATAKNVFLSARPHITGDLIIKSRLLKKLEKNLNQSSYISGGALHLGVRIEKDSIPLDLSGTVETTIGDLTIKGKLIHNRKESLTFDFSQFQLFRDSLSIPCKLQGGYKKDFLSLSLRSAPYKLEGSAIVDLKNEEVLTAELSVQKTALSKFNGVMPALKELRRGTISTAIKARGAFDSLFVFGDFALDSVETDGVRRLSCKSRFSYDTKQFSLEPFYIHSGADTLIRIDSLSYDTALYVDGEFHRISLSSVIDDKRMPTGEVSGIVRSAERDGIYVVLSADSLKQGETRLDSLSAVMRLRERTLIVDTLSVKLHSLWLDGSASLPLGEESTEDSLKFHINLEGDLLQTLEQYSVSAVGGSSYCKGELSGTVSSGALDIQSGWLRLRDGSMSIYPNLWEPMDSVTLDWKLHRADSMDIAVQGYVKRRRLRLKNHYRVSDSIQPFTYGLLNFGAFTVETPDGAIPIFISGFQENRKGNTTLVSVKGKKGVRKFTLSGPFERFKVSGTLLLRKSEFTFPMLDDVFYADPFDPFPYITFDLDIRPADRSVTYFYQLGDSKKRRGLRMIEADLDPSRTISLRGRELDKTFRILGGLRAYRGSLFYGTVFNKNFEMGLDFRPELMSDGRYDNLPIIWGRAENIVVTSTGDQVKSVVKVMVKDSVTGELMERARFGELVLLPSSEGDTDKSNDEKEALFYTETGRSMTDPSRAGAMVTSIGDSYFNSVWLNFWGRRLARKIGFDVLRFETSLLSNSYNYFYERSLSPDYNSRFSIWAFENSGVTMGKYVFGDNLLLKAQTSLILLDTLLTPSYNLGFEYQPFRYLWMDFHYGMHQNSLTEQMEFDPTFQVQMRVPLEDFKKVFKKRE